MKLNTGLLAAGLLVAASAVQAQPISGPYIAGGVGYNMLSDFNVNSQTVGGVTTAFGGSKITSSGGIVGLGSFGYGFGNGFRVELEGNYRTQTIRGNNFTLNGGKQQTYGAMVNGLFDFDIGSPMFYPYLGAGVGYEMSTLRGNVGTTNFTGNKGGLGLQGIVGVGIPIAVPGLSLTAEYRMLARVSKDNNSATIGGISGTVNTGSQYNHSFMIGLRYAFGVPTMTTTTVAATTVAPAPAAARTYLVFFDWDKADLSARARQIIGEAAGASTKMAVTRIEVAGNADKSGTPAYNLGLSKRRADVVASELVRLGVNKQAIYVTANGETKPIVATADGVREPQNRNVEIVLK
ncbi:MAG: OmpA family protein [Acetobacteraceae bacterium]|nr:OmpA family protein [Acetobacteraceae bacterium]